MNNRKHGLFAQVIIVNIAVLLVFAIAAIASIYLIRDYAFKNVLRESREKAHIILDRNLSTHEYFSKQLKPGVFDLTDGKRPEGYFDARWMSSTYAVREIDKSFRNDAEFSDYYYKEAAINARSPLNEADTIERDFIERLNADKDFKYIAEVRTIDGVPYFVVMQKGETTSEGCLMCHSTPEAAPAGLVKAYGSERAFGREPGKVVSALSIRIPMLEAYARAAKISQRLTASLLVIFGVLLVFQVYITSRLKIGSSMLQLALDEKGALVREKDLLMRESHHRVKNNLTILQSLLSLEAQNVSDPGAQLSLLDAQSRMKAVSLIHDRLYRTGDIRDFNVSEYLGMLCTEIFRTFQSSASDISLELSVDEISLDIEKAIPLGLILNEAITNSIKYAFPDGRKGMLEVSLKKSGGDAVLMIRDNGVGIPDGIDWQKASSLGMSLINILSRQIGGRLTVSSDGGTEVKVVFTMASLHS